MPPLPWCRKNLTGERSKMSITDFDKIWHVFFSSVIIYKISSKLECGTAQKFAVFIANCEVYDQLRIGIYILNRGNLYFGKFMQQMYISRELEMNKVQVGQLQRRRLVIFVTTVS